MEKNKIIHLNVKTVPAFDTETLMPHKAYTVSCLLNGVFSIASGWTLRDAIQLFRQLYYIDGETVIRLIRPFKSQHI